MFMILYYLLLVEAQILMD